MRNKLLPINIPVVELTRRLATCGRISARGILLLFVYYIKLMMVMPAAIFQFLFYSRRIKQTVITKHPIFILGHYRSGTTCLHKLMAADAQFGHASYYDMICPNSSLLFGRWLQNVIQFFITRFNIRTSFFNNTVPMLDEPAEEERFLINKGSLFTDYWRFVFPLCWDKWRSCSQLSKDPAYDRRWKKEYSNLLKQITFKNKGRQLILKSPPNTERIKQLLEMFPHAKFIYIYRNPFHVFYSTRNLWNRAIRKFSLQKISDAQMEEIIFSHYEQILEQYERDKKLIPAGKLIEVSYEELEFDATGVLENIYDALNLPGFKTVRENQVQQLQKEKQYHKFEYAYDDETFKKIEVRWAKYIRQWNQKVSGILLEDYA